MKLRTLAVLLMLLAGAASAFAADLVIATQVNLAAADAANNFFTFKGAVGASDKDQYVLSADATSGASKLKSTTTFNPYRTDVKGKKLLPAGLRGLFLYGVADWKTLTDDGLVAAKLPNGVISIQMVHRGTAYRIMTNADGKIEFPGAYVMMRVVGATNNLIHTDFSASGKVANIDWAKVWNAGIEDGKVVGATTVKTGKIVRDAPASELFDWEGALQVTLDGSILRMAGELNAVRY